MAQPANIPFFRGQNVTFKFYQDGASVYLAAKNWSVEQNMTEVNDGVNGEVRDRLDVVTNYFSAEFEAFQSDQTVWQALIDDQTANDAQGVPLQKSAAIQINQRDGGRAAYLLQNAVVGPWSTGMQSRSDAITMKVKMRFTDFTPVTSV